MRLIILVLFFMSTSSLNAQFGVIGSYNSNNYPDWSQKFSSGNDILESGYEIGVDYWFRLNKKRIEFYPTISYSKDNRYSLENSDNVEIFNLENQSLAFTLRTHFYLLDFGEDCDCPTFSKQGPGFEKGFFVHLSPGVVYSMSKGGLLTGTSYDNNNITGKMGAGFGFDIGINDFFTITPIYSYNYIFSKKLDQEPFSSMSPDEKIIASNENQHQIGVRLGFRFDYRKNGRR